MSTKTITRIIIGATIVLLVIIIYIFQSNLQNNNREVDTEKEIVDETAPNQKEEESMSTDRLKSIEDSIAKLEETAEDQDTAIGKLSEKTENIATASSSVSDKKILANAQTKGSAFNTTSTNYSPMGMYVNISCPVQCTLWINFYSSSKNDAANNVNTFGVFLNGQDQSTYSQATLPIASGSVPISLNSAISVSAGTHTVEIQAKTTGGTLRSDVSFLQVMAIEQ